MITGFLFFFIIILSLILGGRSILKRIGKLIILGITICSILVSGLLPLSAAQQSEEAKAWEMIMKFTVTQPVRMAAFYDENFGVTGGFSGRGKANITVDGGKTWTLSESSGGCLFGIEVIDPTRFWVCGRMTGQSFTTPGGIRLSKDGGRSFEPSTSFTTAPGECPMSFIDENVGWFYQKGVLGTTADGGLNWQTLSLPEGVAKVKAVCPLAVSEGYILDETGMVFVTRNQGQTWESFGLPMEEFPGMKAATMEATTAGLRFFDQKNGLAVMSLIGNEAPQIVAFRTSDRGKNWRTEIIDQGAGSIFLSQDGRFVTCNRSGIKVYRYNGEERN